MMAASTCRQVRVASGDGGEKGGGGWGGFDDGEQ